MLMADDPKGTGEPKGDGDGGTGTKDPAKLEAELTKVRAEAADRRTKLKALEAEHAEQADKLKALEAQVAEKLPEADRKAKEAEKNHQALKGENTKLQKSLAERDSALAKLTVNAEASKVAGLLIAEDYREPFIEIVGLRAKTVFESGEAKAVIIDDGTEYSIEEFGKVWVDKRGPKAMKPTVDDGGGGQKDADKAPLKPTKTKTTETKPEEFRLPGDGIAAALKAAGKGPVTVPTS